MKTLLVTNDFPPKVGGIQSYLFGLLSSLDPAEVRVLAPAYPGAEKFDAGLSFEVYREPASRLYPTPRLLRRICGLATGMDVVQFGFALQSWVLAPAMQRRTGVPYVVFVHGAEVLFPLRVPGAHRLLTRGTLGPAARIFSVSSHTSSGVGHYTGNRIEPTVISPIVDPQRYEVPAATRTEIRSRYRIGESICILCVSRLTPRKGQDRLIGALAGLHQRFNAKLLLVGEGNYGPRLKKRGRRLGVEEQVIFTGRVTEESLPAYYAAADVFAMPARDRWFGMEQEGFGVVFAEAAAAGLPMVVGDSGGAREAVEDGRTGFLVNGGSTTAVRASLERLLSDSRLRKKMGRAGRERAGALYGVQPVGERYRAALEEAVRSGVV